MIEHLLLDLDGVVRHFDPLHASEVEHAHGLRAGILREAAFASSLIEPVVTGRISREQWIAHIGDVVGNQAAANEWLAADGEIDQDLIALVDQLRSSGTTVAVLTNGTDATAGEVERLGLVEHFDAIFNTADIGFAKPDRRAFEHVCDALGVSADTVFFTDDSPSKLAGAKEIGMTTAPYTGLIDLTTELTRLGLLPG